MSRKWSFLYFYLSSLSQERNLPPSLGLHAWPDCKCCSYTNTCDHRKWSEYNHILSTYTHFFKLLSLRESFHRLLDCCGDWNWNKFYSLSRLNQCRNSPICVAVLFWLCQLSFSSWSALRYKKISF